MRKKQNETIAQYLRRRLSELEGSHHRIALETGVAQATVSRIYQGQCSPRLGTVQPLLDWIAANDARRERPGARRRTAP